jgi:hypothetical protein
VLLREVCNNDGQMICPCPSSADGACIGMTSMGRLTVPSAPRRPGSPHLTPEPSFKVELNQREDIINSQAGERLQKRNQG